MMNVIEVEALTKSYKNLQAVQGVSFYAQQGTLFALLGENGAGKSTTINMLSTLLAADSGRVDIAGLRLGRDDQAIRRKIGIVFQESMLDDLLTVKENLMIRGGFYDLQAKELRHRIEMLSETLGLDEFIGRPYGRLSGGQRRRADIARALLQNPEILFLDEPTTGLDPASREAIWQLVRSLQQQKGTTVVLTTHYMEEASAADYVVVMGHGKVLAKGTPAALRTGYSQDSLCFEPKADSRVIEQMQAAGVSLQKNGTEYSTSLGTSLEALPLLEKYGQGFNSFQVLQGSMDQAFISIIHAGKERVAGQ